MSKSNDWYLKKMEEQFGDVYVGNNAHCKFCGQPYGEHYGLECPEPISPYELPSVAYDKYFTPPNQIRQLYPAVDSAIEQKLRKKIRDFIQKELILARTPAYSLDADEQSYGIMHLIKSSLPELAKDVAIKEGK